MTRPWYEDLRELRDLLAHLRDTGELIGCADDYCYYLEKPHKYEPEREDMLRSLMEQAA